MGNPEPILDSKLVESLRMGDQEAFTAIYKKYWYRMYCHAHQKLKDREAAEEIVQDIFTYLWKECKKLNIGNLENYLFSAVRYEVIDVIRVRGSQSKYVEYYQNFFATSDLNTQNTVEYNELLQFIDNGLEELPDKSREIFKLNRLDNWSVTQIAKHYKLSEKAVEYHITKATKSIRAYLTETLISVIIILL
jgi:RNA polymerase sigma-70 factor (family 1)